ncbi:class I SAM-dependent methyltransferase [Paracidovorax valerianellae]|uniref:Predicted methyltransferase regulatory domain-containing protein n=1 Tax=Paracidovorax valerianellae TaxID=187868 RepID=A0A1G6Z8G1_9BURK|nr:class I SAM-dependent methyltransferase [Paracidovorax valerianellae]MDA8445704.1 class I SAM-dependent methyltransferase [Paracidovorax valerianellae]SDD98175.1 Predicted methyltransferase regulatory domain-containing protein [Paracidovorax valerianellae]
MKSPQPAVLDVRSEPYTRGYYRALSPAQMSVALESRGVCGPDLSAPLNCFELGMGFGLPLVAHAACFPHMRFYGNDFNPHHVAYADQLARDAGLTNVEVFEDAFETLLERDLPPMDIISMHGVYSWISPALRKVVMRFIAERLRPGGVVFVSHNALPGWAAQMPLRELVNLHGLRQVPVSATPIERLSQTLDFLDDFAKVNPAYFGGDVSVQARLYSLRRLDPHYAAHEYFNPDWHPMHFHQVASEMAEAGLEFAAPAVLAQQVDAAILSDATRELLSGVDDPLMRETLRDFALNTSFRWDLYTRGAPRASAAQQEQFRLDRAWILATARSETKESPLSDSAAEHVDGATVARLLDALAQGPATARELAERPELASLGAEFIVEALMLLENEAQVHPALPAALRESARESVLRFNAAIMQRPEDDGLHYLSCSASGQAMGWSAMAMAQIRSACQGAQTPLEMADAMRARFQGDGEGQMPAERLEHSARCFFAGRGPVLRNLGLL